VARFIGRANLVAGTVERIDATVAEVMALGRRFIVSRPEGPLAAGQRVRLLLRPEAIGLGRAGAQRGDRSLTDHPQDRRQDYDVGGRVVSRTFLGEKVEYAVACMGETLQIVNHGARSDRPLHVGDAVALEFVDTLAVILDDAAEGNVP
jgi:ABC-type Fe3+/spermidine/putrescine transport system ATPase subunit